MCANPRDQRLAVARLEFVELRAVDDARDDLADVERDARVARHDAVEVVGRVERFARLARRERQMLAAVEVRDDVARDRERMRVVLGEMIGDAGDRRVHVGAAERFGVDDFAGRRLHQRRTAEEDRALFLDDDRLVAHRRHVRAAGRARAHDDRDLRNAERAHARLVVEDAAEVIAIRKHLVLQRQERTAGIDEVDAGQAVLERDLLRAQMLLHRDRKIRAALDRRVVGDDEHLDAVDAADAGDDAGARRLVLVHAVRGERREFEERRARIEQRADALARQQLAALGVLRARLLAAAFSAPCANCAFRSSTSSRSCAAFAWNSGERGSICERMAGIGRHAAEEGVMKTQRIGARASIAGRPKRNRPRRGGRCGQVMRDTRQTISDRRPSCRCRLRHPSLSLAVSLTSAPTSLAPVGMRPCRRPGGSFRFGGLGVASLAAALRLVALRPPGRVGRLAAGLLDRVGGSARCVAQLPSSRLPRPSWLGGVPASPAAARCRCRPRAPRAAPCINAIRLTSIGISPFLRLATARRRRRRRRTAAKSRHDELDRDRRCFAAADAERGDAALAAASS